MSRGIIKIIGSCFFAILLMSTSLFAENDTFSLKQCIERALKKNVSVITAKNQLGQSKQNLLEAWGLALPDASASAGYNYRKTFGAQYIESIGASVQVPGTKSYSTSLDFSVPLFDGFSTWFNIRQKSQYKKSATSNLTATENRTAYEVKSAYYGLVSAIMLYKVQADALARSNKQLEITNSRYELGSASLSEKLKAEVSVANDSLRLLERDNDIRNAEFGLNLLMNRDISLPIVPTDELKDVSYNVLLDEAISQSFSDNPNLIKSKADLDAAKSGIKMAQASWVPRVDAFLSYDWVSPTSNGWFKYKYVDGGYVFGVRISYSLFDAFRKKTNYSNAKLYAKSNEEAYIYQKNITKQTVQRAFLEIQKSKLQYEAASLADRSAEQDMRLQEEKYRLGASSILDLLDAQVSLTDAQYTKVLALYNLNLAIASMEQALGKN